MGRGWFSYCGLTKKTPMSNTKSEADTRVPVIKIRRIQTHLPYFQNIERSFFPIVYIMLSRTVFTLASLRFLHPPSCILAMEKA